jgi:prevent-host-death family protein
VKQVSVHEAKAHFSAIMKDVEAGEVVIVTRHDKPIMELRSVVGRVTPQLGAFAEQGGAHLEVQWTDEELTELFGDLGGPESTGR